MSVVATVRFESNDFSELTGQSTDGGDFSVASAAALAGTQYGGQFVVDDTNAMYGYVQLAANKSRIVARIYIDPNGLTMGNGESISFLFLLKSDGSTPAWRSRLYYSSGQYYIQSIIYNDAGGENVSTSSAITDDVHFVEVDLVIADNPGDNDGSATMYIDDSQETSQTGHDNDDRDVRYVVLGPLWGADGGTSGTFYLDELIVNDDGAHIGPLANVPAAMHSYRRRRVD